MSGLRFLPLIVGLVEHWQPIVPDYTAEAHAAKFRKHMNRDRLPIRAATLLNRC